jgi:DNA replication initiation complex subunit (GINS family)
MTKEPTERDFERLLNKLKQDPQFELKQELGVLCMKHIDSLTPEERKRYDELLQILKPKQL